MVNGHPLDDVHSWYHRNTGYVRQLATPYYDELTVRENLLYSALLRLPSSHTRAELFEQMKMVINEVNISMVTMTVFCSFVPWLLTGVRVVMCLAGAQLPVSWNSGKVYVYVCVYVCVCVCMCVCARACVHVCVCMTTTYSVFASGWLK